MDSVIDRILNGDFDDDDNKIDIKDCLVPDPDEDDEPSVDEGEEDMEEFLDDDSEDYTDDTEEDYSEANSDSDLPSEEFYADYIKQSKTEAGSKAMTPKNSISKNTMKDTKETEKMNTNTKTTPKNSATTTTQNVFSPTTASTSKPGTVLAKENKGKRGRGRPLKMDGTNAEEVVRLYSEGVGAKAIGEKFNVSVSCVINCLKSRNIAIRPKGRRKGS